MSHAKKASGKTSSADLQERLVKALQDPYRYKHPGGPVRHIETHISHVLLTGDYAYKIKKPVNLGFLDFSTLEQRHFFCDEEVRLNRRLAPEDYLATVTINGSPDNPRVEGHGPVLDYAVKMRQFDPDTTLDCLDAQGLLSVRQIDAIAAALADFHAGIAVASADSGWGTAEAVWAPVEQNFIQIGARVHAGEAKVLLESLRLWSEAEQARLAGEFESRQRQGFIREGHGDLHLGNMAWRDNKLLIFDCIEFNPALRWIDVMSEAAFCYMDLLQRGHPDLASRFINRYLERTGDYAGMQLLRFYAVYRAMVRAKVAFIRASQTPAGAGLDAQRGLEYLRLAEALTRPTPPRLVITHGLSGSGKTTFGQDLVMRLEMISLRSDIERKRLAGLDALARSGAGIDSGIYSRDFSRRTYEHLAQQAETLLQAGWSVLVDATFIAHWQRELFQQIAARCGVTFHILDFDVPEDVLRQRVRARSAAGGDASEANEAVLEQQLKTREPLTSEESALAIAATAVTEVLGALA